MRLPMSRLLAVMLCALPCVAFADPVYIEPVGPVEAGQIVEVVRVVLYPERPCYLSIPDAGQMNAAEIRDGGISTGACWASSPGDSITAIDANGNSTKLSKTSFLPARTEGWKFEILTPEPFQMPRL